MRERAHFIDMLRGMLIIYVVLYHLLYDVTVFLRVPLGFFWSGWFQAVRTVAVSMLLIISGMVSGYSRSVWRRAFKLVAAAGLVTAVSLIFMPNEPIWFGILHLFAACTLLFGLLGRFMTAVRSPWLWAALSMGAFLLLLPVDRGYVGLAPLNLGLPAALYSTKWLIPLGFAPRGFISADYYPLLPWGCAFFAGGFLSPLLRGGKMPPIIYTPTPLPALEKIGQRTLMIYLIHQPVFMAVIWLIFWRN